MSSSTNTGDERLVALRMMQDRGVDDAESLFEYASPATIIYRCKEYDREKTANPKVHKGLLVWKVKQGDNVQERVAKPKRPVYNLGSLPLRLMGHDEWLERRGYAKECPDGTLMVTGGSYPVLEIDCDKCDFSLGLPHRGLGDFPEIEAQVLGG